MSTSRTVLDRASSASGGVRRLLRGDHPNIALAIIVTCQLMLTLDATVVNIALPQIQGDLHFSATALSWVLNAYLLAFGGLLLLGGRTGDTLGRRRVFLAGILLFTFASLLGGLAPSAEWLVAARAAQGIGAAFAAPSALAFIATTFAEGPERNRALGLYSAAASAGGSLGLLLGGMLTSWASWRWALFINVPVGVAVVLLAPLFIREPDRRPGRLDLAGALTGTTGMAALVYGFIRAAAAGWGEYLTVGSFALAIVLLGLFLTIESRAGQPLVPLRLFADRNRASAYFNVLLFFATLYGAFFFLTQFLQDVLGFGPLEAGLAFLPMTLVMFATIRIVPQLLSRVDPKPIMVTGAVLITGAIAWLTQISATSSYTSDILVPLLLLGAGVGCGFLPLTVTILSRVQQHESGAASGVLQTMQQVGGALGLAILVTVFGTASRTAAEHPLAGATVRTQEQYILAYGIGHAFAVSAIFATGALVIALVAIRSRRPSVSAGAASSGDATPNRLRSERGTLQPVTPRETVEAFLDAAARHDVPALVALVADEVDWRVPSVAHTSWTRPRRGREEVAQFFADLGAAERYRSIQFEIHRLVSEGDTVAVSGAFRFALRETGKAYDGEWALLFEVADGQIRTCRMFGDPAPVAAAFAA